jgi:large subunit ribosomal protein L5
MRRSYREAVGKLWECWRSNRAHAGLSILKAISYIASVSEVNTMAARLKERYKDKIVPALTKEFSYKNTMAVPKLKKIVLNMGVGREAQTNSKVFDQAAMELSTVSGQKTVVTKAKKSIAAFKLRTGMPVGVSVTLRGDRMFEFLDRFINAVLPRVRDFRGVSPRAFDGRGNYTIGIKDQLIFPEIDFNKVDRTRGMNISIVTTARTDEEGRALLKEFGMPFTK